MEEGFRSLIERRANKRNLSEVVAAQGQMLVMGQKTTRFTRWINKHLAPGERHFHVSTDGFTQSLRGNKSDKCKMSMFCADVLGLAHWKIPWEGKKKIVCVCPCEGWSFACVEISAYSVGCVSSVQLWRETPELALRGWLVYPKLCVCCRKLLLSSRPNAMHKMFMC